MNFSNVTTGAMINEHGLKQGITQFKTKLGISVLSTIDIVGVLLLKAVSHNICRSGDLRYIADKFNLTK